MQESNSRESREMLIDNGGTENTKTPFKPKSGLFRKLMTQTFAVGAYTAMAITFLPITALNAVFALINGVPAKFANKTKDNSDHSLDLAKVKSPKLAKHFNNWAYGRNKEELFDKTSKLSYALGVLTFVPYHSVKFTLMAITWLLTVTFATTFALLMLPVAGIIKLGQLAYEGIKHLYNKHNNDKDYNKEFKNIIGEQFQFTSNNDGEGIFAYMWYKIADAVYFTSNKEVDYSTDDDKLPLPKLSDEAKLVLSNRSILKDQSLTEGIYKIEGLFKMYSNALAEAAMPNIYLPKGEDKENNKSKPISSY